MMNPIEFLDQNPTVWEVRAYQEENQSISPELFLDRYNGGDFVDWFNHFSDQKITKQVYALTCPSAMDMAQFNIGGEEQFTYDEVLKGRCLNANVKRLFNGYTKGDKFFDVMFESLIAYKIVGKKPENLGHCKQIIITDDRVYMDTRSTGWAHVTERDLAGDLEMVFFDTHKCLVGEKPDGTWLGMNYTENEKRRINHPNGLSFNLSGEGVITNIKGMKVGDRTMMTRYADEIIDYILSVPSEENMGAVIVTKGVSYAEYTSEPCLGEQQ